MADKTEKTKARLPRGFVDRSAEDIRATEKMMATIRAVFELYGFEPVDQPLIEFTDALGKFLPDQDRPNEGVFSFQDDDEQWLSLRYDLTAPMARFVAENYERLPKPYRSYRSGWVFRNEKPGPGRFRQFMQFDADTVGTPGVAADAEMAMMMADVMEALGIERGDYVIRVNNRKVLDGVLEAIGLGGDENAGRRLTVLRAIDKLDKFGPEGVRLLLGPGRWDGGKEGEGDFTKGAGLDEEQTSDLIMRCILIPAAIMELGRTLTAQSRHTRIESDAWSFRDDQIDKLAKLLKSLSRGHRRALRYLSSFALLDTATDRIRIDPSVVRGLEYYTGPVYEAELLAEIPNEDGQIVRFGSVGGGGRYDGLVSRFRGEPVPATGFSIGVSRLMTALKNLGKLDTSDVLAPVVVLVMDRDTESLGRYQKMVAELRAAKIRAEMYLGGAGMKAQIKYADRRGSPIVVIQGGDERARGEVQIKDLIEGARMSETITDNAEWRAARPAQVTVAEADMVAEVKKILARRRRSAADDGAALSLPLAGRVDREAAGWGARQRSTLERCLRTLGRFAPISASRGERSRHDLPLPLHRPRHPRPLRERGADTVDVPVIQPADPFLDMAGEDLRRRIFLTESETGETLCLRPEFTIPVCLDHISSQAETPRRYAYLGEVFRQRREGGNEFFQAGIEDLGDRDTAAADARSIADAHALLTLALPGHAQKITLGDQTIFEAVLAALGLPRGWRMRLARAFGSADMLAAALADLASPPKTARCPSRWRLSWPMAISNNSPRIFRPAWPRPACRRRRGARRRRSPAGSSRRPNCAACACRSRLFRR